MANASFLPTTLPSEEILNARLGDSLCLCCEAPISETFDGYGWQWCSKRCRRRFARLERDAADAASVAA